MTPRQVDKYYLIWYCLFMKEVHTVLEQTELVQIPSDKFTDLPEGAEPFIAPGQRSMNSMREQLEDYRDYGKLSHDHNRRLKLIKNGGSLSTMTTWVMKTVELPPYDLDKRTKNQ
jgi:hypothetical protein